MKRPPQRDLSSNDGRQPFLSGNAHAERMSDGIDLINTTGTKATDIELLERHHIGLASSDHVGDPPWVCSSVRADTSVDVVSHDAQRSWPCALIPAVERIHRLL